MTPISRKLPRRAARASLAIAVILVLLIGVLAYRSWSAFGRRHEQVQITRQVLESTNALLSALKDAETGQRGFLLTGEDRYLEPYRQALAETPSLLKKLDQAMAFDRRPDQAQRVEKLRQLVRDKLAELDETIQVRQNQGLAPALAIVRTDRGRAIFDQVRTICAEVQSVANERLARFSEDASASVNQLGLISSIASAILLAFLFFASLIVKQTIQSRDQLIRSLAESEERFRNMADTAPVMIWTSGPDKLCTFLNQVWLGFTGRALEQELGNGWAEGVHPDDLDRCLAIYSSSFDARQRFQMEFRMRRADGTYRWVLNNGIPRLTAGGVFEGYIGSCIDVTDLKKAQERFRLVVEASPTAMVMVDGEGKIVLVNSRTEKLFGYGRQELAGQPVEILVPESLRDAHQTLRNEYLLQPIARPMGKGRDLSGRRKDGAQVPVEIGLAPIETEDGSCVLSSIVDISERKLAEERLREGEARFRAIFFQAAVGMSETTIDGEWLLLNDRLSEILGYSRDELLGKTFYYFTHPDDREASLAAVQKLLAGEISSSLIEKRYIRKDGVPVWVRVFMSLVRGPHNEAYLVRVVEDITERIEAERAIQESRQELLALTTRLINAQEDEGRRISRQLHDDFSQRLALIAFDTSSLVQSPPPSLEQIRETLGDVHTRILQMSADVRGIAHQLHPSILEDLGLAAALHQMCEEFSTRERIEATLEQKTILGRLPKDVASCLYWIAREALHNISKYARASRVRLLLSGSPEGIQVCIQDDGVGFDPEAGRRHGLGIISMKERVRMVNGELSIHSQPGRGTEVRAFVPVSKHRGPRSSNNLPDDKQSAYLDRPKDQLAA